MNTSEMAWEGQLGDGSACAIVVDARTRERLGGTCFREGKQTLAGKFATWRSPENLLADSGVRRQLLAHILATIEAHEGAPQEQWGTFTATLDAGAPIGWSSTTPPARIEREFEAWWSKNARGWRPGHPIPDWVWEKIERFTPNNRSTALRFKIGANIPAPATPHVTLQYSVYHDLAGWNVKIWTMYPGHNLGQLHGDVTREHGVVFFDWNHPGEPLRAR